MRKLYATGLSLILISLAGCGNALPGNSFCLLYEPVYTAPEDTEGTKRQVDENNGVYLCECLKDCD